MIHPVNNKAIVAFSGDPITYGHIDIIERALNVFEHVTVGIGVNPDKKYTFSLDERLNMAKRVLEEYKDRISVIAFQGLLVDFAYEQQISTIIRGVRNSTDVDYEQVLHEVNESQNLGIDTYILFANKKLSHVSSSAVKELQKHNAKNILEYVPLYIKMLLEQEVSGQHILGVTGEIGAGKSYVAEKLIRNSHMLDHSVHNIDLDSLGHMILEKSKEPFACEARRKLRSIFNIGGSPEDFIKPKDLGHYLWGQHRNLQYFNNIMFEPMLLIYRKQLRGLKGIILLNSALLVEASITHLCNNNVLLITADPEVKYQRLLKRGYSEQEAAQRMDSQLSAQSKKKFILASIEKNKCGDLIEFDNSIENDNVNKFKDLVSTIYRKLGFI